jgi:cytidyltransferase-like protein
MISAPQIVVSGPFDDLRSRELRFLDEAAKLGALTVLLWPDDTVERITGRAPKFPLAERRYLLNAVRTVKKVVVAGGTLGPYELPIDLRADVWADYPPTATEERQIYCHARNIPYRVFDARELGGFQVPSQVPFSGRKKVVVTGCYDWLHSGHVRFFEEVSQYGDLIVILGNDENIRFLKGEGHPLQPQDERRYMVGSIKFVASALIASGSGWLDADPEIRRLKPDIYAVNADGDKGGKRDYCLANGIEYLVLNRDPAPGLPRRSSTDLRGF